MAEEEKSSPSIVNTVLFFVFYVIIVICWLVALFFKFFGMNNDQSMVLAKFLTSGERVNVLDVDSNWVLTLVDFLIKGNLFFVSSVVGTFFLVYFVLPKMKHLNAVILPIVFFLAYLPTLITIIQFLMVRRTGFLENYVTSNQFWILLLITPLNFAVFFYLYFILDRYVFRPMGWKNSRWL